jgi:chromatin remodeling complex protein RSC6
MPAAKKSTSTPKTVAKKSSGKKSTGKKSSTKSQLVEAAPAPAETVPEPEPVVAAAPAAEAASETVSSTEESTDMNLLQQIESDFSSITERLSQFKTMYTSITSDLRKLQKNMAKHVRENSRKKNKRKVVSGDKPQRAPSGFAKPALISDELCSFLGKSPGTEMARTEVTKYLTSYIKEHELQDQANKRKILPDDKLKKLLNLQPSDEVTYFNLQKYMKVHFPKSAATLLAEASAKASAESSA